MKKKNNIQVKVEKIEYPAWGFGTFEDREYKFKGAILGQKVEIKRTRGKKAKLIKILEKSDLEEKSSCPHSDLCGGCSYQTLSYKAENNYKKKLLEDLLKNNSIETDLDFQESPEHEGYRNKMEYTFGDEYLGSDLALGLHRKDRFYEVVNTDGCKIVHRDFDIIREKVRKYFDEKGFSFYNRKTHQGILRHLVIRRGFSTREIMVNLVTTREAEIEKSFINYLLSLELEGQIKTIIWTKNDSWSDAIIPQEVEILYGEGYIKDKIEDNIYKISPFSFFQTNTQSAEKLFRMAIDMIDPKDKTIYDLYCGAGTIGISIAKHAKEVIGCEIVEEAVKSARENAILNGHENISFYAMDVGEFLQEKGTGMDLAIVDPPREGLMKKAIENLLKYKPKEILYISCNPETLCDNLKDFKEAGYEIKALKGLNQFPRTRHVEAIALIQKMQI
ncbi:23S rRNA (uracil-5-)-methyltransferase RumA [Clostridiales bacterium KA00134]|nr:23S rRNA (uracil-5-)-methyltransferase RumA [Clostridiales bacterium KA00134]